MSLTEYLGVIYKAFISPSKPKRSYSQYSEDLIIQSYFPRGKRNGRYVDVGCHHPRRGSNTYGLYKKGWSGILIDLEECKVKANQLARKRDKVILAAVSDSEEWLDIYSDKKYSTNTTIKRQDDQDGKSLIGRIKTQTLTKILEENHFPTHFELLSIDVEGVDFEVLKGLNLNVYRPEIICIENWKALTGIDSVLDSQTHQYLNDHQYQMVALTGLSTIYKSLKL
jgi:FkbM family methyltransferase